MLLKEDEALQFSAGLLSPDRPFKVKYTENHLTAVCRPFLVEISDLLPDLLSLVLLRLSSLEGKLTSVNNKRSYSNQSYLQEYCKRSRLRNFRNAQVPSTSQSQPLSIVRSVTHSSGEPAWFYELVRTLINNFGHTFHLNNIRNCGLCVLQGIHNQVRVRNCDSQSQFNYSGVI